MGAWPPPRLFARRAAPVGCGAGSLSAIAATPAARRWLGAELAAYAAWTAVLTFVGAFFIQRLGAGEAETGWLLAAGAAAYVAAAARSGSIVVGFPLRTIAAGAAVAMGSSPPCCSLDLARWRSPPPCSASWGSRPGSALPPRARWGSSRRPERPRR